MRVLFCLLVAWAVADAASQEPRLIHKRDLTTIVAWRDRATTDGRLQLTCTEGGCEDNLIDRVMCTKIGQESSGKLMWSCDIESTTTFVDRAKWYDIQCTDGPTTDTIVSGTCTVNVIVLPDWRATQVFILVIMVLFLVLALFCLGSCGTDSSSFCDGFLCASIWSDCFRGSSPRPLKWNGSSD